MIPEEIYAIKNGLQKFPHVILSEAKDLTYLVRYETFRTEAFRMIRSSLLITYMWKVLVVYTKKAGRFQLDLRIEV